MSNDWLPLQSHYERCLDRSGPVPAGVDWPNAVDLEARFATQMGVLRGIADRGDRPVLLDLGCGPGLLLDWLAATGQTERVRYLGVDISPKMIAAARARWPGRDFVVRDILAEPLEPGSVDVVVMNGVLTERREIPRHTMVELAERLIAEAFRAARHGVAFNTMSRHVDWERQDLFHWGFDEVADFLTRRVTRHFAFDAAYGLYEFTCFAWRAAQRPQPLDKEWWGR